MRDLIRNYKRVIAGGNRDSGSDSESQPLASSSYTSSGSYGSLFNPQTPNSESEEDNEKLNIPRTKLDPKVGSVSPLTIRRKIERQLIFGSNFEPPELDVFTANEFVFDKHDNYAKIAGYINDSSLNIQKNPNILKAPSFDDVCYDGFMDYRQTDPEQPTNNSLVTIFAIWNTTMGSSLLAMSWGIQMAGLFPGIAINILIAALCLYTCHLLLNVNEKHGKRRGISKIFQSLGMPGHDIEVSHLCQDLLGKWAEVLAKIFSVVVLLGADIVYMVLMSNFLYNSVYFFWALFNLQSDPTEGNATVLCPKEINISAHLMINSTTQNPVPVHVQSLFDTIWDLYSTVPIVLSVIMFGVLNFKSPTFFTKFNSLGTISVLYLLIFVAVKAFGWGINLPNWQSEFYLKPTFSALSGMLSLSYFIHNIIISVMRNNKHQEHNGRDLTIAFGLVTFTYLFIGIVFYVSFPLAKSCIEDNIFNNFSKNDIMTIIARILLLFQLFTVFPLISFMLRNDIMGNINQIFKNYRFGDFTYRRVMFLNGCLLFVCVMFACFMPKIGTLIRYTGAMSGLVYIFMLPNLLQMASLKKERRLTFLKALWHVFILVAGTLNLLSQFFISD